MDKSFQYINYVYIPFGLLSINYFITFITIIAYGNFILTAVLHIIYIKLIYTSISIHTYIAYIHSNQIKFDNTCICWIWRISDDCQCILRMIKIMKMIHTTKTKTTHRKKLIVNLYILYSSDKIPIIKRKLNEEVDVLDWLHLSVNFLTYKIKWQIQIRALLVITNKGKKKCILDAAAVAYMHKLRITILYIVL